MYEKKEIKLREYFEMFLKDFSSDKEPVQNWVAWGNNGTRVLKEFRMELPPKLAIRKPYIVFIIFVYLKEFSFSGRWEKVAWEIPITFKGKPFVLTHRKFGFRIIANDEDEATKKLAIEAISQIHKSIKYAEKLIEPVIRENVNKGNITLENEYGQLRRRYSYFRNESEQEFKTREERLKGYEFDKQNYLESVEIFYSEREKGLYLTSAMLDAFFSLLEQTFVLLIPFVEDTRIDDLNIEQFILDNWKDKYRIIFDLQNDVEANRYLDKLIQLKEHYRNPLAHGNFLKEGSSMKVHMRHLGIVPMHLTQNDKKLAYSFKGLNELKFEEICQIFDEFERFLSNHQRTKYGMIYIQNQLPVPFDQDTRKRNFIAMACEESFEEYIRYIEREIDNAMNMDW